MIEGQAEPAEENTPQKRENHKLTKQRAKKETQQTKIRQRLFGPSCLEQLEIPPVRANSNVTLDVGGLSQSVLNQPAR